MSGLFCLVSVCPLAGRHLREAGDFDTRHEGSGGEGSGERRGQEPRRRGGALRRRGAGHRDKGKKKKKKKKHSTAHEIFEEQESKLSVLTGYFFALLAPLV